jgi:uncharacterized membrane protein YfcA
VELGFVFFLYAGGAVLFAGISKGGFGSGAAFASSAILALVIEPGLALGVMLPLLMLIDVATLPAYWGKWRWRESMLLILGGVPGVAAGALFYTAVNADALRVLIGAIAVAFVAWQVAQRRGWVRPAQADGADWNGLFWGVLTGFTSFVSHAGGPPAAVFLLGRKLNKTEYQASSVLVFWIVNITKAIPYTFLGLFTLETIWANVLLSPFAVAGVWIGVKAHALVPERIFFGLTYVLLLITGSRLIWLGLA